MATTAIDRDRILAELAMRTGLASAEGVTTAMAEQGGRPLGDVLVERGDLEESDRSALEHLAESSLVARGGDAGGVLSGFDAIANWSGWDSAIASGMASIARRRAGLTGRDDGDPGPEAEGQGAARASDGEGRFRALRLHARGGHGEVFVARDEELNREVALKRLQPRYAGRADHRARFLVEAEVTGRLEHPGIVPVYSLGADADGRPFYAMRLVRGETFQAAIDAFHRADLPPHGRTLGLRKLIGRLIDACQAIAYAHSRGVLHRDLKPSNVMLGGFGETLIVDWGLARARGAESPGDRPAEDPEGPLIASTSGASETAEGALSGTPAFMSPEQASGASSRIGPATDVYGLGAILYVLLTGRMPLGEGQSPVVLLGRARRGEVVPIRSVRTDVPPALAAIGAKAMALRPEDRYESALALADDLERWLADEPVSAHHEPWSARLARWRRRHGTLVTAASAVLIATVIGLAIGASAINAERAVAVADRDLARREHDRAEQEFRRARRAVDDSFTRVSQEVLLDVPGLQALRKDLLSSARGFYEEFVLDRGQDPSVRADLAETHSRLAGIAQLLGRGEEVVAEYEAAVRLRESLASERGSPGVGDDEEGRQARLALALDLDRLGVALLDSRSDLARSRQLTERAISILEAIGDRGGDRVRDVLAGAYANLGSLSQFEGRAGAGLPLILRGISIREELARRTPGDRPLRFGLARMLINLALLYKQAGPDSAARSAMERAVEILEGLHRDRPEAARDTLTLVTALDDLGRLDFDSFDLEPARRHLGRARDLITGLVRENPRAVEYRASEGSIDNILANLERRSGRPDVAARHAAAARDLFEGLAREHPGDLEYRDALSQAWNVTGRLDATAGRRREALAAFDRAAGLLAEATGRFPARHYNAACNTALGLPLVAADPVHPTAAEGREIEARAGRAVASLRAAAASGFTNVDTYLADDDLHPLRSRPDFRDFLAGLLAPGFPARPFAP
ncbi:serine/threonine-protein kinase [Aquisphaera insulae]|uniref:serine/threonine-protein kinase n=1 Tax=Aquisphaera insulae TaxID=2712864 RepID=UPI0013EC4DAD|nr:serine/threonine-protein kinase [Aquisphaera insulae]